MLPRETPMDLLKKRKSITRQLPDLLMILLIVREPPDSSTLNLVLDMLVPTCKQICHTLGEVHFMLSHVHLNCHKDPRSWFRCCYMHLAQMVDHGCQSFHGACCEQHLVPHWHASMSMKTRGDGAAVCCQLGTFKLLHGQRDPVDKLWQCFRALVGLSSPLATASALSMLTRPLRFSLLIPSKYCLWQHALSLESSTKCWLWNAKSHACWACPQSCYSGCWGKAQKNSCWHQ